MNTNHTKFDKLINGVQPNLTEYDGGVILLYPENEVLYKVMFDRGNPVMIVTQDWYDEDGVFCEEIEEPVRIEIEEGCEAKTNNPQLIAKCLIAAGVEEEDLDKVILVKAMW